MKGLSLHQPWASAIALGLKENETRGHRIHYRGPLAICAARTTVHAEFIHDERVAGYFRALGIVMIDQLPFGRIVAVAEVVGCWPADEVAKRISRREFHFGDYSAGRWAWALANVRRLVKPILFSGTQGIFNVPDSILADAEFAP